MHLLVVTLEFDAAAESEVLIYESRQAKAYRTVAKLSPFDLQPTHMVVYASMH